MKVSVGRDSENSQNRDCPTQIGTVGNYGDVAIFCCSFSYSNIIFDNAKYLSFHCAGV